jgi:polyphosphate kinase
MPDDFLKFLRTSLKLNKNDLIPGGKYHNFHDFFSFPKFNKRQLEYEAMPPLFCKELDGANSILGVLSKKDILLNFPYQSYGYVINLLEEAANDVNVKSIKITLYRVANESLIVRSLCKAVENGKKVTAFVEYKARFDEEANFSCAEILHKAGVKVYSSFPGLKVHCKLCLIERTENEKPKYYIYLATGNFNEKTARIYCDCALLTKNTDFSKDAQNIFNILQRKSKKESFNHLIVAPFDLRKEFTGLIKQEINNANEGKQAEIILKLNSLEDRKMIKKLYEASNAGVKVKIIVRGICCLVPGIKDQSENINVISIVDRFLEHTRIYIFHNNGDIKYFLASADLMRRNLNRRIEIGFPIYDKRIQSTLQKMIDIQWSDNVKARIIDSKQSNNFKKVGKGEKIRSQYEFYKWLSNS